MSLIDIKSGNHVVVANGSVISLGRTPIKIDFMTDEIGAPAESLSVEFSFHEDETKKPRQETKVSADNKTLQMMLYNFDSPVDTGNTAPLVIGQTNSGKQLNLNYRVRKLGDSWTLDYTIYRSL
ncbi:MAG: hypothetical protein V4481_00610 [Patescibacteria group bacterium]